MLLFHFKNNFYFVKKTIFDTIGLIFIAIFLAGCFGSSKSNLDISSYSVKINTKLQIPEVCMAEYKYTLPKVAVLDFVNNSTYGKAKVNDKHSAQAVGLGFGVTGFVAGAKSKKYSINRTIDTKLSESITPLIETIVLNTGGATVYTRSELDRVNDELKLQESGILDPNSVVEFGKLSGVQYLITGTIDNATADYRGYSKYTNSIENAVQNTQNSELKLASSVLSLGAAFFDGTDIQTQITIKIIDVSNGKIIFTQAFNGEIKVSNRAKPTYDEVISGIKNSIKKTMPELEDEFAKHFTAQGYITKLRKKDDELIAQINLGTKLKVKEGDEFSVFTIEENIDPLTGVKTCDKIKLPTTLKATNQITSTHAWTKIKNHKTNNIKILQLIQKVK